MVLWFGPYHKNIVDEAHVAAGFVFNEKVDVTLFEYRDKYICVCRGAYFSDSTAFDLKVKLWLKDKIISCQNKC